jgi:hypothetical protein
MKSEAGSQEPELRTRDRRFPFALCLLLLSSCLEPDLGPMPEFVAPRWVDGETSVFEVTRGEEVLYRSTLTVELDEEMAGPAGAGDSTRPIPTIVATNRVEPVSAAEFFFDSVTVVFRRDDLKPLRSYRTVETDISEFEITSRYGAGKVSIQKQSIDGTVQQDLKLPQRSYSYDMVQTWLRAVPLVSGTSFRANFVVPIEFRTVLVKVSVLGTKLIATPLGDIMCREIVLILPNREVRFWYELNQPHRFVGLNDTQSDTRMVLAEYILPAGDSLAAKPAP